MDANLLHTSYEGKILEDPSKSSDENMYTRSVSPESAPDKPQEILIEFRNGDPIKINYEILSPANLLKKLNKIILFFSFKIYFNI